MSIVRMIMLSVTLLMLVPLNGCGAKPAAKDDVKVDVKDGVDVKVGDDVKVDVDKQGVDVDVKPND